MSIVIYSIGRDLHARAIKWTLERNGIPTTLLDPTLLPSRQELTIDISSGNVLRNVHESVAGEFPRLNDIRLVWARRFVSNEFELSDVHPDDEAVVTDESGALIENVWSHIGIGARNAIFMNNRGAANISRDKAFQLHVAKMSGLQIPETIMSNSPKQIREFFDHCNGGVVVKPFYQSAWPTGDTYKWQGASILESKHLVSDGPLRLCPAIYQRKIDKLYELRIVMAGERTFAVKLNSQSNQHSNVDWRHDAYVQTMSFERYDLPEELIGKLYEFMSRMGLQCGSIDMIMSPKFGYVFLEVNEQGQFLFLEKQCREVMAMANFSEFLSMSAGYGQLSFRPMYEEYRESEDYSRLIQEITDHAQ